MIFALFYLAVAICFLVGFLKEEYRNRFFFTTKFDLVMMFFASLFWPVILFCIIWEACSKSY